MPEQLPEEALMLFSGLFHVARSYAFLIGPDFVAALRHVLQIVPVCVLHVGRHLLSWSLCCIRKTQLTKAALQQCVQATARVQLGKAITCAQLLALDHPGQLDTSGSEAATREARLRLAAALADGGVLQVMQSEALRLLRMAGSAGELEPVCKAGVSSAAVLAGRSVACRSSLSMLSASLLLRICHGSALWRVCHDSINPTPVVVHCLQVVELCNAMLGTLQLLGEGAAEQGQASSPQAEALGGIMRQGEGMLAATRSAFEWPERVQPLLAPAAALAPLLRQHWAQPEQAAADRLAVARAAAARSCAYLRCANLGGEGGPAAGEGVGSQRCR